MISSKKGLENPNFKEKKGYTEKELKLAMELVYDDFDPIQNKIGYSFITYRIVATDDGGLTYYNVLDEEKNKLYNLENIKPNKLELGKSYFNIYGSADIVLCRTNDIFRKKSFTLKEIRDSVLEVHPTMYFEDAENVKENVKIKKLKK